MSRARTALVFCVMCLGCALVAVGTNRYAVERDAVAQGALSGPDSASPAPDAAIAACVDNASPPALAKGFSEETRISPRSPYKRFVLPSPPTGRETQGRRCSDAHHASNWVPSYLPESEFCTVLSRFRL
jgi:hypothetical protein